MTTLTRRTALGGLATAVAIAPLVAASGARAQQMRIDNAAAMNGVTEVVIGSFIVAFLTDRTDRARAGGGLLGSGFGGRSTARSALHGVSAVEFQRATDAAYADFLRQLAGAGYQIADRAAAVEAFTRANAQPLENGIERRAVVRWSENAMAGVRLLTPIPYERLQSASGH